MAPVLAQDHEIARSLRVLSGEQNAKNAQVNVRLKRSLKEAGDAALAEVGLSPSDAVRALWTVVAQRGEARDQLLRALDNPEAQSARNAWREEQRARILRMVGKYRSPESVGDIDPYSLPPLSDDDWEELAYQDFVEQREGGETL